MPQVLGHVAFVVTDDLACSDVIVPPSLAAVGKWFSQRTGGSETYVVVISQEDAWRAKEE